MVAQTNKVLEQHVSHMRDLLNGSFRNVAVLTESHDRLDEQFCILARLLFRGLNNLARGEAPQEVTYREVNEMFKEFAEFKKRPDFRDHFRLWYMGEDLSSLPPPPAKEEEGMIGEATPSDFPEGATIFGGDADGSENRDRAEEAQPERAEAEGTPPDEMSELSGDEDRPEGSSELNEDGDVVCSV